MAAQLADDGTMDTVVSCTGCGEEARYTYNEPPHDGTPETVTTYTEFVKECLADFDESHECERDDDGEGEPADLPNGDLTGDDE